MTTIKQIDHKYSISSDGYVFITATEYKIAQSVNSSGYVVVTIHGKTQYLHRLLGKHFIKQHSPKQNQINHIDGNKQNNSLDNLEFVTQAENIRHAMSSGIHSTITCLSDDSVRQIRKMIADGVRGKDIAQQMNCTTTIVSNIKRGATYKDII